MAGFGDIVKESEDPRGDFRRLRAEDQRAAWEATAAGKVLAALGLSRALAAKWQRELDGSDRPTMDAVRRSAPDLPVLLSACLVLNFGKVFSLEKGFLKNPVYLAWKEAAAGAEYKFPVGVVFPWPGQATMALHNYPHGFTLPGFYRVRREPGRGVLLVVEPVKQLVDNLRRVRAWGRPAEDE
jgi:hypothetical protein